MNRCLTLKLCFLMSCIAVVFAFAPSAYAANVTTLEDNQTHTVGDLTGDGVADNIKVLMNFKQLEIYVNDKLMLSEYSSASTQGVSSLNFDNGKSALYLVWGQGSRMRAYHGLYDFPGGTEVRRLADFYRLYPVGDGTSSQCTIDGLTTTATIYQHGFSGCPPYHEDLVYKVSYKWSGNKLVRSSKSSKIKSEWSKTPYYNYKLYKAPGSKKAVTIVKKNTKAKGLKIQFVGKKCYMQIKTKTGKIGWHEVE